MQSLSHTQYDPDRSGQFFHKPPDNDGHPVTDWAPPNGDNSRVTADALTRTVRDFLGEAAGAMVLEDGDGDGAFDLGQSKYSISGEYNKCLLHLWSAVRNKPRPLLLSAASRKSSSA